MECNRRTYIILLALVIFGVVGLVAIFFLTFDLYKWSDGEDEAAINNCTHKNNFWIQQSEWQCSGAYNGNYLKIGNFELNWQRAEDTCLDAQQQDAQLISISNVEQENIIKKLISQNFVKTQCKYYWIGATRNAKNNDFEWSNGETSTEYLKQRLSKSIPTINESDRIAISSTLNWTILNKDTPACYICGWDPKDSIQNATDCKDLKVAGKKRSGIYNLYNKEGGKRQKLLCEMNSSGGGWTVFQQRFTGVLPFWNQTWNEYREGFGEIGLQQEFWAGNERIHQMTTKNKNVVLRVELWGDRSPNATNVNGYWESEYNGFSIGNETNGYTLNLIPSIPSTTGNASAAWFDITYGDGFKFSTIDRINDPQSECVTDYHLGGWWLHYCSFAALNGEYNPPIRWSDGYGMIWVLHGTHVINPRHSRLMFRSNDNL